jgi:hypothetical protein
MPDFVGVVLDPAGLRIVLRELLLREPVKATVAPEEDGTATGRSLIEGKDELLAEDRFHQTIRRRKIRQSGRERSDNRASKGLRGSSLAAMTAGAARVARSTRRSSV